MTFEIGLLLGFIFIAMVLFAIDIVAADIVAVGLLLALILSGMLDPAAAFAGFGSETALMILGLLILTAALIRTGVVDLVGTAIMRRTGTNPNRLLLVVMLSVAALSAFISNTAATAFFVPVVIGLARQSKVSPSRLLMPLAFASILSSPVTLISSSSNLVISGLMTNYDLPPLEMFEMSTVGLATTVVGLAYMYFIGRRLIPESRASRDPLAELEAPPYSTEIVVLPDSPMVGQEIQDTGLYQNLNGLTILKLEKGRRTFFDPRPGMEIDAGDVMLIQANRDDIIKIMDTVGVDFKINPEPADTAPEESTLKTVEAVLLPGSPLIGRSLKRMEFYERYGLQILGIARRGRPTRQKISRVRLRVGDQLLIQGDPENIASLSRDFDFRIIGMVGENRIMPRRAPLSVGIFVFSLVLATFNVVSLAVAVLIGVLLVFATRCITPEEAYREIEWKAFILIGAMLALGAAMEQTGAAQFIAGEIVNLAGQANPLFLLAGFFLLTLILTQPMSNQAAAVVVIPVAIQTALQLDLNPRTFAIMIAIAASCSYMTPLEPSCLMVYGPGGYRFTDFLRVGTLLTLIIFAIALFMVPMIWPF